MIRTETGSHCFLDGCDGLVQIRRGEQLQRQFMNFGGQDVIGPGNFDEFSQLALQLQVFLAQDRDLSFHKRNRAAAIAVSVRGRGVISSALPV